MMTGPPYPRYAPGNAPGGNAIGSFIIGESPIGTIPAFDWWTTVIAQYANSPIITQLIDNFFQYIDPTQNMDLFFDNIFNIDSAIGYGLDVQGRRVGVQRTIQLPNVGVTYLGFEEATGSWTGFGQSGFYSGGTSTSNFSLSNTDFRTLIFAKALGNISDGSIPSMNQLLLNLFPGRGTCYVADNQNMSLTLVFKFALNPVETAIITQSGVLPIATGVAVSIQQGPLT